MKHSTFVVSVMMVLMACSLAAYSQASDENGDERKIVLSQLSDKVKGGVIDWENQMIYASGAGAMPTKAKEPNRAKALLKAQDYAKMDAIANLLMAIKGTTISYEVTGQDLMAKDVKLTQTIEGYVKNVDIVRFERQKVQGDTIVIATVGTPMYGREKPVSALVGYVAANTPADAKTKPVPLIELPVEVPKVRPMLADNAGDVSWLDIPSRKSSGVASSRPPDPGSESIIPKQTGPFTALIVDTRGYDVLRAICPKIRRNDGTEVWGTVDVDADYAIEEGIVAYAKTLEKAKECSRSGANPLIVNAVGRAGGKAMCDTVISDDDAKLVLDENKKTKFMDGFKVIMVSDPSKAKATEVK